MRGSVYLGAAYRNRTDDLRITRTARGVHGRPLGHSKPVRTISGSAGVHGDPGMLLADALAASAWPSGVQAAPRWVGPPGPHARRVRGQDDHAAERASELL